MYRSCLSQGFLFLLSYGVMTSEQKKAYNDEYNRRNATKIAAQRKEFRRKNKDRLNAVTRAWRGGNKEYVSAKNLEYRQTNGEKAKVDQKEWYDNGGKVTKSRTGYQRNLAIKQEFVDAYGGACKCGETNINRLCADHVNDDGCHHRRSGLRGSTPTYRWAKKNGWPPTLQLLCHNCNEVKRKMSTPCRTGSGARQIALQHYSHGSVTCALCPCNDVRALQIDHIDGGGRAHSRELWKKRETVCEFLVRAGFPPGYRVLCASCNLEQGILARRSKALHLAPS